MQITKTSKHPHGEQLSAYVDGMLDVARMRGIDKHVRACAVCQGAEQDLRATKFLLRGLPEEAVPGDEFWTTAYRRLRVDDRERAVARRPLGRAWAGPEQTAHRRWAAGLAAVTGVGLLMAGPLSLAPRSAAPTAAVTAPAIPAQDVSPDVPSLVESHTDSVSRLPLADPDRQKMIAADVQQPPADAREAAGYADGQF